MFSLADICDQCEAMRSRVIFRVIFSGHWAFMNSYSEQTGRLVALLLIAGSGIVAIAKGMSLSLLAIRLQRDFG